MVNQDIYEPISQGGLRDIIYESLQNAVDNGYTDAILNDAATIAADILEQTGAFEEHQLCEAESLVKEWKVLNGYR